jgi:hypothetical protein
MAISTKSYIIATSQASPDESGTACERISDESLTPESSFFVHYNMWISITRLTPNAESSFDSLFSEKEHQAAIRPGS